MKNGADRASKPASPTNKRSKGISAARLDQLIEEAIVDAYGDSEQTSGFYTMLEDHLATNVNRLRGSNPRPIMWCRGR